MRLNNLLLPSEINPTKEEGDEENSNDSLFIKGFCCEEKYCPEFGKALEK